LAEQAGLLHSAWYGPQRGPKPTQRVCWQLELAAPVPSTLKMKHPTSGSHSMAAPIARSEVWPKNMGVNGSAQVPIFSSVIVTGGFSQPDAQATRADVFTITDDGRLLSMQVPAQVWPDVGSKQLPLDELDEDDELLELLEEEDEEYDDELELPDPPLPVPPPLPPDELPLDWPSEPLPPLELLELLELLLPAQQQPGDMMNWPIDEKIKK